MTELVSESGELECFPLFRAMHLANIRCVNHTQSILHYSWFSGGEGRSEVSHASEEEFDGCVERRDECDLINLAAEQFPVAGRLPLRDCFDRTGTSGRRSMCNG